MNETLYRPDTEDAPGADVSSASGGAQASRLRRHGRRVRGRVPAERENIRLRSAHFSRHPAAQGAPFTCPPGSTTSCSTSASLFAATGVQRGGRRWWAMAGTAARTPSIRYWIGWDNAGTKATPAIMLRKAYSTTLATYLRAVVDAWVSGDGIRRARGTGVALWVGFQPVRRQRCHGRSQRHFPDRPAGAGASRCASCTTCGGDAGRSMVVGFGQNPALTTGRRLLTADGRAGVSRWLWCRAARTPTRYRARPGRQTDRAGRGVTWSAPLPDDGGRGRLQYHVHPGVRAPADLGADPSGGRVRRAAVEGKFPQVGKMRR
jgi:hypothetical protein